MASSNTLGIYEKDGRRFKMTPEHAERVGARPVTGSAKAAAPARNKQAPPAQNKAAAPVDLTKAKKDELIALAEARDLDTSGTKDQLIERLTAAI